MRFHFFLPSSSFSSFVCLFFVRAQNREGKNCFRKGAARDMKTEWKSFNVRRTNKNLSIQLFPLSRIVKAIQVAIKLNSLNLIYSVLDRTLKSEKTIAMQVNETWIFFLANGKNNNTSKDNFCLVIFSVCPCPYNIY